MVNFSNSQILKLILKIQFISLEYIQQGSTMNTFENVINQEQTTNTLPATTADRIAAMVQRVTQPIELWTPTAGDVLIGEIFDKKTVQSQYGPQEQFIVRTQHGQLFSYWLNKYISEQFKAQGAGYGSVIAVTYLGKAETATGKPYHRYDVLVDNG